MADTRLEQGSRPPQPPPVFTATVQSISDQVESVINTRRAGLDRIAAAFTPQTATFESVVTAVAREYDVASLFSSFLRVTKSVSPHSELRDAAGAALKKLNAFETECNSRDDIFGLWDAVYRRRASLDLTAEDLRYLEKVHKRFILHGLNIPPGPERQVLQQAKTRLGDISIEFARNLNTAHGDLWLTAQDLEGLPERTLGQLEKESSNENDGRLRLPLKSVYVKPVLKYATKPEIRKQVYLANENKCEKNRSLFREAIILQDDIARLLGYKNHAALKDEDLMTKIPDTVNRFLDELRHVLLPYARDELVRLQQLKRQHCSARNIPQDGKYYDWDSKFYERLFLEQYHEINEMSIAEYFPLESTLHGMLATFEKLMGMVFLNVDSTTDSETISPTGKVADLTWHPDVIIYSVWNSSSEGSRFIGYLYLDLYPRPGKYAHSCNMNLRQGFLCLDGTRNYPATVLICNFSLPNPESPSLLKHHEIVTLFHELGHAIHNLTSRTRYSMLHGAAMARDFVEAPSQMLENWFWTPSVLTGISNHWKTGQQIPNELVMRLVMSKNVNRALNLLRDLHFSLFDMVCHSPQTHTDVVSLDLPAVWNTISNYMNLVEDADVHGDEREASHGYATFGHLVTSYSAAYYGYLYSQVISTDMFHTAFRKDPMNEQQGRRYRYSVLAHGGSRDEMDIVTEFLGRPPNTNALYEELRLNTRATRMDKD